MPKGYPKSGIRTQPFNLYAWPPQRQKARIKKLEAAIIALYHDADGFHNAEHKEIWWPVIKELTGA